MYFKACFLFLLLTIANYLKGQEPCTCKAADTLRKTIGKYYNSGKLDSAELVLNNLKNDPNKVCTIVYLDGLAQIHIAKKEFTIARAFLAQETLMLNKLNCKKLSIRFNNTLARYYQETGSRDSVLLVTIETIELAEQEQDWYAAARASINLAAIFQQEKQIEKYVGYSRKALSFARLSKDTIILAAVLTRTAKAYVDLYQQTKSVNHLDSAFLLSKECILISRNKPSNLLELADAYNTISRYYSAQKRYSTALSYTDSSILVSPKNVYDFYRHLLNSYASKSEILFTIHDYVLARRMADSSYHYAILFNKQLAIQPLEMIFETSKALKDFKRSALAHEEMTRLKDSIFTIEKTATINELEKKYNQAKNEQTIKELSLQKTIYLLLAVIALLGIGVIGFFLRQQSLKHQQKVLETEQRLNRARMNPHFFFNVLASFQSLLLTKKEPITIASNLAKFSGLMRETLESTYKDSVPITEEIDFLKHYLDLQLIRYPEKFTYAIQYDESLEIADIIIPSMIIQPFIENSIEHGFKNLNHIGHINISFSTTQEALLIKISDNGKGLPSNHDKGENHVSRATQILKDRIYLLNMSSKSKAKFSIQNVNEGGVLVEMSLPLVYQKK